MIDLGDTRLLDIEVDMNGINALFINIYMPYACVDIEDEFLLYLGRVNDLIESYSTPYVYVMGDFNANVLVRTGNPANIAKFGKHLLDFCVEENIALADVKSLSKDSFTFISSAHNSVSWLDHIITTGTGYDLISNVDILKDLGPLITCLLLCSWIVTVFVSRLTRMARQNLV